MWNILPTLKPFVQDLAAAFTQPSLASSTQFMLAWIMCLGRHTLLRCGRSADPTRIPDHSHRHGLDVYYNFFERSAWDPKVLFQRVGIMIVTRLRILGSITLLVDDTLTHKRGKTVFGLGWFRDAVASTKKRTATASGHNWVVIALAYQPPWGSEPILAIPLLARLHLPGKGQPSCPTLAKQMLSEVLGWYPDRSVSLVGDGAYACKELLSGLDERVVFVGRMRGDAALYDPRVPRAVHGKRGRKATKGPRLPKPKEAGAKADRKRTVTGEWVWQSVEVTAYGCPRSWKVVSYVALWPHVLGLRPVRVVVVRDPSRRMRDCYLFTTDLAAAPGWVIEQFAWRWSIEVMFRASKQVMGIDGAQHWCQKSVEKLAPWVWSMQSVIMTWYLSTGHQCAEAEESRARMGAWDSEWSLRHMMQVLRSAILNATINPNSAESSELRDMVQTLKNWANLAA